MSLSAPQLLLLRHDLDHFDCGKPSLNEWLLKHAKQAITSGSARTFIVTESELIAGYFSLTVGEVDTVDAPQRIGKGMGHYPIPVVILARLAVATSHQKRGIGPGMLQDAIRRTLLIAEQAGIRAMLTHPLDADAERFYMKFGFEASPVRAGQLFLLLKDARRISTAAGLAHASATPKA